MILLLGSQPFFFHHSISPKIHHFLPHNLNFYHSSFPNLLTLACIQSSRTQSPKFHPLSLDPNTSKSDAYKVQFCPPIFSRDFGTLKIVEDIDQEDRLNQEGGINQDLWLKIKDEAQSDIRQEPLLSTYYYTSILSQSSLSTALANHLSMKLSDSSLPRGTLFDLFIRVLEEDGEIIRDVEDDLRAVKERDPACASYVHCFLNFKGFLACQGHRMAHKLWLQRREVLALLIQSRVSDVFAVDIHPGAKIGHGILLDHATGVVVGETAVIGNNVSILHNVTLGGTGKSSGDRHPKIGDGVLIGAGTCILGNIRIGEGAKIGAGSVVLKDVPARTTAAGNPARLIGGKENPTRLNKIPSFTMDHTSHASDWSDYVI